MSAPETKDPAKRNSCRWCGRFARYQPVIGFCSRGCAHEFYGTTESEVEG